MHVKVDSLRQQMWRAERVYADFIRYAKAIGCNVYQDSILSNEKQARLLATWWMEHAT